MRQAEHADEKVVVQADIAGAEAPDIVDLRYMVSVWLRWSWVPVLFALAGAWLGYGDLRNFTPQRMASMVVEPTGGGGGGSSLGQLEAAAASFGIQLGSGQEASSPFDRFKLLLGSVELAQVMEEKHGLLRTLYADSWDEATQVWQWPTGEEFERQEQIRAFLQQNPWRPPSIEGLSRFLVGAVKEESVPQTFFRKLSVTHEDGEFALWLLATTYSEVEELLRRRAQAEWTERMGYIREQLRAETSVGVRDALIQLLSQELGRQIVLEADLPYAASIVEAPRLSELQTEPNIALMIGVRTVALGAGGFLLVTLFGLFRFERKRRP